MFTRRSLVSAVPLTAALPMLRAATVGKTQSIERGMQALIDAGEIPGVVTLVATRTGITHFLA